MIKSFRHKGLERLFETGSKAGIQATHAPRLRLQLAKLDAATVPQDMNLPGWHFHKLEGKLGGHFAVTVNKNWRMTFAFDGEEVILVDYQDYH
ncbi:MAG: type II toxin-antitoxin system RelE/ParE family toxin [Burkholderiales bacterium]